MNEIAHRRRCHFCSSVCSGLILLVTLLTSICLRMCESVHRVNPVVSERFWHVRQLQRGTFFILPVRIADPKRGRRQLPSWRFREALEISSPVAPLFRLFQIFHTALLDNLKLIAVALTALFRGTSTFALGSFGSLLAVDFLSRSWHTSHLLSSLRTLYLRRSPIARPWACFLLSKEQCAFEFDSWSLQFLQIKISKKELIKCSLPSYRRSDEPTIYSTMNVLYDDLSDGRTRCILL